MKEVREGQIYDILKCVIKKKRYKGAYLQNRSRVTDVDNKLMTTTEKSMEWIGRKMNWETGTQIHTTLYKMDNE